MKKLFASVLCSVSVIISAACTTFLLNKNGQLVFGRNYDWITATGMVTTNLRGLQKTSMKQQEGNTISWISKYGSISFNQYGKEFPNGGMNEKGLVVEMMWLDGSKFPEQDDRASLGVLQWIQYELDQCSTVDEVIASDKILRINGQGTPVHYLVADATGNVATIEFLDGKMAVHKGKDLPFPVLTNNTYAESIAQTAGSHTRSFADNSIDRFAKACSMVQQFKVQDINIAVTDYAFSILEKVSQPEWTRWSIVYDITNKKISFRSHDFTEIKSIGFASFDFSCAGTSKMFNINQNIKGDVSSQFRNFTIDDSRPLVEAAVNESRSQVNIPDQARDALLNYSREISCKQ